MWAMGRSWRGQSIQSRVAQRPLMVSKAVQKNARYDHSYHSYVSLLCVTTITLMLLVTPPHTYHSSPGLLPAFTPWTATASGGAAAPTTTLPPPPRHRHIHETEGTLRGRVRPAALLMPQVHQTEQIQLGLCGGGRGGVGGSPDAPGPPD